MVVAQFWQAITMGVLGACWDLSAATSIGWGASTSMDLQLCPCLSETCALLDMRLLKAGHPLHPSAPPVPLHRPPPGHVPVGD